jgi:hypothetical protein
LQQLDRACRGNCGFREGQKQPARKVEASFAETAKERLYGFIGSELAAFILREAFDNWQVLGIGLLGFTIVRQCEDRARDIILALRRAGVPASIACWRSSAMRDL